jgi:hypothetical protein
MKKEYIPILRFLYIPDELYQILRLEKFDNIISFEDIVARYAILGLGEANKDSRIRGFPRNPPSKSIAVPTRLDDFIMNKARIRNTNYNNIFMEYLILGVKNDEKIMNDRLQSSWIKELDKFCTQLKNI